jgi:hypothetical protein
VLLTCTLVSGLVEKLGVLLCGRWCLPVSSGVFGGKEMKTLEDRERSSMELESFLFYSDNCICSSLEAKFSQFSCSFLSSYLGVFFCILE